MVGEKEGWKAADVRGGGGVMEKILPAPKTPPGASRRPWTSTELRILRRRYPNTPTKEIALELGRTERGVYATAFSLGLSKAPGYKNPGVSNLNKGGASRFPKGHQPWNAGLKGWFPKGSERSWFSKGRKPQTWVPVGTVVEVDGYKKKKVADTGNKDRDWKFLHVLLWERYRGKVPRGKFLVFKDRDKANIRIGNLMLTDCAGNMKRNSVHNLPAPVKSVIVALRTLKRRIKNNGKY
jgi:hypothetical protein